MEIPKKSGFKYVWSVFFAGQSRLKVPYIETCYMDSCNRAGRILYNNGFQCKEHYNTLRDLEKRHFVVNDLEVVRPELKEDKAVRLENENIMSVVAEDEDMMDRYGKDWIQELNETEKGEV